MTEQERRAEEEIARIRTPKAGQIFGIVEARLGYGHMRVAGADKKVRVCRVPGALRRQLWIKVGDIVLIEPWKYQSDEKADIVYKYTRTQAEWLRNRGFLKELGQ